MAKPEVLEGRYEGLVESASGQGSYELWIHGDKAGCPCKHGKMRAPVMASQAEWCRHAFDLRGRILGDMVAMLRAKVKIVHDPVAGKELLEEIGAITLHFKKTESNAIATAFLLHAFDHGEACADDIHELVGKYIEGDKRIIGLVAAGLLRKGLMRVKEPQASWCVMDGEHEVHSGVADVVGGTIRVPLDGVPLLTGLALRIHVPSGDKSSARREVNHGRGIKRFVLTDAGKESIADSILRKRGRVSEARAPGDGDD